MKPLDEIVIRAAMMDARKHLAHGRSPSSAARLACVGAWAPYCGHVEERLTAEQQSLLAAYYDDNRAA